MSIISGNNSVEKKKIFSFLNKSIDKNESNQQQKFPLAQPDTQIALTTFDNNLNQNSVVQTQVNKFT